MIYINKKTGKKYKIINTNVIDATNGRENEECMVLYSDSSGIYVRKESEFYQKFYKEDLHE